MDPFPEQSREEDAGAVFVLESKGDLNNFTHPAHIRISRLDCLIYT